MGMDRNCYGDRFSCRHLPESSLWDSDQKLFPEANQLAVLGSSVYLTGIVKGLQSLNGGRNRGIYRCRHHGAGAVAGGYDRPWLWLLFDT